MRLCIKRKGGRKEKKKNKEEKQKPKAGCGGWCVIPAPRRLRQENYFEFQVSLVCIERFCLKKEKEE